MKKIMVATMGVTAFAAMISACGGSDGNGSVSAGAPSEIRTTWFGISNFHYQVGKTGFILDGEVVNSGNAPSPAAVTKALSALRKRGSVDYFLVGHEHGDHALQIPEYAKQTGKPIYAPAAVCQKVVAYGNPAAQCTTIRGGETIALDEFTTVRVVRWLHSLECGQTGNGTAGVETFGFLITANTFDRVLSIYASDSGAGGQELSIPRVVNKGLPNQVTYGSPLENLSAAFKAAGIPNIDLWQGGPESDVVSQARILIPTFNVKYFQPHHLGTRNTVVDGKSVGFSLEYGLHFPYLESEVPKLTAYLKSVGATAFNPVNYFDAWALTKNNFQSVDNAEVKAVYGLPATGTGPGKQGPNPRSGQLECAAS
jgi:hypothetical protein